MKLVGLVSLLFTLSSFGSEMKSFQCAAKYFTNTKEPFGILMKSAELNPYWAKIEAENKILRYESLLQREGQIEIELKSLVSGVSSKSRFMINTRKNKAPDYVELHGGDLGYYQPVNEKINYKINAIRVHCYLLNDDL